MWRACWQGRRGASCFFARKSRRDPKAQISRSVKNSRRMPRTTFQCAERISNRWDAADPSASLDIARLESAEQCSDVDDSARHPVQDPTEFDAIAGSGLVEEDATSSYPPPRCGLISTSRAPPSRRRSRCKTEKIRFCARVRSPMDFLRCRPARYGDVAQDPEPSRSPASLEQKGRSAALSVLPRASSPSSPRG